MVDPEIIWQHLVEDTGRGQTIQKGGVGEYGCQK